MAQTLAFVTCHHPRPKTNMLFCYSLFPLHGNIETNSSQLKPWKSKTMLKMVDLVLSCFVV